MEQYPDSMTVAIQPAPTQKAGGDWNTPTTTTFTTECRAEENKTDATVKGVDGESVSYSYKVFQPQHTTEITPGSAVTITKHDGRIISAYVMRHENGQLNSRTWV